MTSEPAHVLARKLCVPLASGTPSWWRRRTFLAQAFWRLSDGCMSPVGDSPRRRHCDLASRGAPTTQPLVWQHSSLGLVAMLECAAEWASTFCCWVCPRSAPSHKPPSRESSRSSASSGLLRRPQITTEFAPSHILMAHRGSST